MRCIMICTHARGQERKGEELGLFARKPHIRLRDASNRLFGSLLPCGLLKCLQQTATALFGESCFQGCETGKVTV